MIITCSLIGKSAFTMGFAGIYVYSLELFPTNLRSTGLGLCQLASKAAAIIAPYSRLLVRAGVKILKCTHFQKSAAHVKMSVNVLYYTVIHIEYS